MSRIPILFMSVHDWANSGFKMCQAVNRHSTKYECHYFTVYSHVYGYNREGRYIFEHDDREHAHPRTEVIDMLRDATEFAHALHYKEDVGVLEEVAGVKMPLHLPTMLTFCGSHFRAHDKEIYEMFKDRVKKMTVTTPNLIPDGAVMDVLPFAFDEEKYKWDPKSTDCIIIGHNPSRPGQKGSSIIAPALEKILLEFGSKVFVFAQNNIPFYVNLELKRLMHIYIDQIAHGAYGNSAVESMAMGSAVLAKSSYGAPGVLNVDESNLYEELRRLVTEPSYLMEWQHKSHAWFHHYHSYAAVAAKVERYYDEVLS